MKPTMKPLSLVKSIAVAALLLTTSAAGAAEKLNVKPGLWEMTSIMRFSGVPPLPKDVLDRMTPEQRSKMAADLEAAAEEEPEPDVSSECITREDLDKPFESGNPDDCTQTIVRTTRTTQEIRLVCTGETKGSGVFRVTTPTPETMTGVLDLKAGEGADAFTIKGTIEGRWLGPDCDDEEDDEIYEEDEDEMPEQ